MNQLHVRTVSNTSTTILTLYRLCKTFFSQVVLRAPQHLSELVADRLRRVEQLVPVQLVVAVRVHLHEQSPEGLARPRAPRGLLLDLQFWKAFLN